MSRGGSVRREFNSTWTFVVDIPGGEGRRQQVRRRGFPSRRDAQAALVDLLSSAQQGCFVKRDRTTLETYLTQWMESLPSSGRSVSTISSYRHNLRLHVVPYVGGLALQDVEAVDLDRLYRRLASEGRRNGETGGLSMRTVRYVHTILSVALSDAVKKGLLVRNPAKAATPPSAKSARAPEMEWWRPEELTTFLEATAHHELGLLFRLAAVTGMRRGELLGLHWADVDPAASVLTVRRQAASTDYQVRLDEPKTERGRRRIDLDADTTAELIAAGRGASSDGVHVKRDDPVFLRGDGSSWHPETVSRTFDRLVIHTGLPRIRFHDLRHTHVAHLISANVDALTISRRLGHASVAFTLDRYGHLFDQAGAGAAEAVLTLLGSSASRVSLAARDHSAERETHLPPPRGRPESTPDGLGAVTGPR